MQTCSCHRCWSTKQPFNLLSCSTCPHLLQELPCDLLVFVHFWWSSDGPQWSSEAPSLTLLKILKVLTGCDLNKLLQQRWLLRVLIIRLFSFLVKIKRILFTYAKLCWRKALSTERGNIGKPVDTNLHKYFLQDFISCFRNYANERRNGKHDWVATAVLAFSVSLSDTSPGSLHPFQFGKQNINQLAHKGFRLLPIVLSVHSFFSLRQKVA